MTSWTDARSSFARGAVMAAALGLAACTSIAGLDGDYQLGAGGASATATSASSGAGPGSGGASSSGSDGASSSSGSTSSSSAGGMGGSGGMPTPVCGDGHIDPGEECDDGPGSPSPYCVDCNVPCDGPYEVEDPQTHHCYYDTVTDNMHTSWQAGRSWCLDTFDGDLAVISHPGELAFLQSLAPNGFNEDRWIGASDLDSEGDFEWVSNALWIYVDGQPPWDAGQPSGGSGQDCVVLRANGTLNDASCSQGATHQMCERAPEGS